MRNRVWLVSALLVSLTSISQADLRLPAVFSDNMVLQQNQPLTIWGWSDKDDVVTISYRTQIVTAQVRDKCWKATLKPVTAGGPDIFTVSTRTDKITLTNVLAGEVWVCSGQSNMEWPLSKSQDSSNDVATADNALIRFFKVPKTRRSEPTNNVAAHWEVCSPQQARDFSAIGYYFGRDLLKARGVPVGLIGTYWGGTPAESWTSLDALTADPRMKAGTLDPIQAALKAYPEKSAAYDKARREAAEQGREFKQTAPRRPWVPAELYNGMIAPLVPYAIAGAIWYQGEANAERAQDYRDLFPGMIRCWRTAWSSEFPFLFVQLAPYDKNKKRTIEEITSQPGESDWAELREAQLLTWKSVPKTGMAVITDVGTKDNIHPPMKEPVGARLALAARAVAYDEKMEYSGPVFRSMKIKDGQAVLTFDHTCGGLQSRDGEIKGFAMCDKDGKWTWASAIIESTNTIVVSAQGVLQPVAVRYGWADYPVVNLENKAGLPATPFRTDDFPMITGKKP
jgi:sialate O-acetylesterase